MLFQSTPSVGRATFLRWSCARDCSISIHALRGEGDSIGLGSSVHRLPFQSTPSVGRATLIARRGAGDHGISIHALRGEGDLANTDLDKTTNSHFNPRPPWGGRLPVGLQNLHHLPISIHALRGEGDALRQFPINSKDNFNPRPPWGGRPRKTAVAASPLDFNPRPPWGGRRSPL